MVLSEALTSCFRHPFRIKVKVSLTGTEVFKHLLYYRKYFFLLIKRRKNAYPKHQVFLLCVSSVIPCAWEPPCCFVQP